MAYGIAGLPRFACTNNAARLVLIVLLWSSLGDLAAAQTVLGRVEAGSALELSLDQLVTPAEIIVEIDGVEVSGPHILRGNDLFVVVPDGLLGTRHDVRVYRIGVDGDEEIGAGLFETTSARALMFGSVQTELGARSTNNTARDISTGVVRLEFDNGDGQERGRLVVSRGPDSGEDGADEVSIDDVFFELRRPLFGDNFFFRLGNSDILSQTDILDTQSRRGVTLRLSDPALTHDLALFMMQTETDTDLDNPLGLSDTDDRVVGLNGIFQPQALPGLRFDITHFDGRSPNLPSGGRGKVSGSGVALFAPVADGRGDISVRHAETRWSDSEATGGSTDGRATEVEANWQLAARGGVQSFVLGAAVSSVDVGFFSPLNPDLIRGETSAEIALEFVDPAWQWRLDIGTAETNTGGSAADPVDRINRASASVLYDPGDFTGGFLNGTRLFANLALETLDRLESPTGAIDPQDNTIVQSSFGMEKVQPGYNWAWAITHDTVRDRADRGADQSGTFVSARLGLDPSPASSAQFFARAGERRTELTRYDEAEASFLLSQEFEQGLWEASFEGGYLFSQDPDQDGGRFATASVSRELSDKHRLVAEASWGRDRYAPDESAGESWSLGLFIRTDFAFQRD
ncbi:MAG: hypothetical protein KJN60_03575 [Boseongicola sp.]|nr:hypothetical protein [Boseongicola sp.]